jgi:hypothetical protein
MKHCSLIVAWVALLAVSLPVTAADPPVKGKKKGESAKEAAVPKSPIPPYIDFIHGLMADGLADVAFDYLQSLRNRKDLPPEVAAQLPLEVARAGMGKAQLTRDPRDRDALYQQAHVDFEAFIKANPTSLYLGDANLELGRVLNLQAKAQLARARIQEVKANRRTETAKARPLLEQAAKYLQEASNQIDALLAKNPEPNLKKKLFQLRFQADLEQGLVLYDQGKTFDDDADVIQRGDTFKKAIVIFTKLAARDEKNPTCWLARAWLVGCYYEVQDPTKAQEQIVKILREPGAQADAARRLASYFRILLIDKISTIKDPVTAKISAAEEWLTKYPDFHNSQEGYAVRYELADAYYIQAAKRPKGQQNTADTQSLYAKAQKMYEGLEKTESEFAEPAREKRQALALRSVIDKNKDLDQMETFQECFLKAQYEIAQIGEVDKKKPADADKQRDKHYRAMIDALNRALDQADNKASAQDLIEARYLLAFAYYATDHPYQAAIVGEELARSEPKSDRAATAGAYALEAYAQILGETERREAEAKANEGGKEGDSKNLEADINRVRDFALYMQKTWPTNPATDLARQQLGGIALRHKKYAEAIAALSQVTPDFGGYNLAQFQLATAAMQAKAAGLQPVAGQPLFQDLALAALKRIPDLKTRPDASTAQIYFLGKLELAKILFSAKQYQEMEQLTAALTKHFDDLRSENILQADFAKELEPSIKALPLYAAYGHADTEFRAGKYPEALKLIVPIADQYKQDKLPELKDPVLIRSMLGLGLRAAVRANQREQAQDILNVLLQKSAGGLEGASAILTELVSQLKGHIEELRAKGPAAKAELDATVASFTAFLDQLARQPPEKMSPDLIRFLAFSYASLDRHLEAAQLLGKIPEPAAGDGEKEQFYHAVRLLYIRELRQSTQYEEAKKEVLKALNSWGAKNVDIRFEQVHLLEDQNKYAAAARAWNDLMTKLRPQLTNNAKLRDKYFECYYHMVVCFYKNAQSLPDEAKKQKYTAQAAGFIHTLKTRQPDMGNETLKLKYDELLQKEAPLKQALDEMDKASR